MICRAAGLKRRRRRTGIDGDLNGRESTREGEELGAVIATFKYYSIHLVITLCFTANRFIIMIH